MSSDILYRPDQAIRLGEAYLKGRQQYPALGVPSYILKLDELLNPLAPGDLCTILGRPGNGKTSLLNRWARHRALHLNRLTEADLPHPRKRIVVLVSTEQPIEELYAFHAAAESGVETGAIRRGRLTDEQWSRLFAGDMRRLNIPLWFVGHSLENRRRRPRLTPKAIYDACRAAEDEGFVIDLLLIDFLQRLRRDGKTESKIVAVSDNLDDCKDLGLDLGCPVILGAQARREVDEYKVPVPLMDDGQWASNIEQASQVVLSAVRPCTYKSEGEMFGRKSPVLVRGKTQMLIMLLKQTTGAAGEPIWVSFDPRYNTLEEAEVLTLRTEEDD